MGGLNMKRLLDLLVIASILEAAFGTKDSCDVGNRDDCGHMGTTQSDCEASGCCWRPANDVDKDTPWCFYPDGDGPAQEETAAHTTGMQMVRVLLMNFTTQCL